MGTARILAVDDQNYFRAFIEGILTEEGYMVCTASSGQEALHALEREFFDIVVTDLVMPGMSGVELVTMIRDRWPEQEIVVVTGVGDVKTAVEAMKHGATEYLLKPIDRSVLLRALESILQSRRLRDEHSRLMAENLEYMGMLSVYERAVGLFATHAPESLAERIVEGLCLETRAQGGVPVEILALGREVTDCNAALFDVAHGFRGCIAGVQHVLHEQGLLTTAHCLDPRETLSPGQAEELARVRRAQSHLDGAGLLVAEVGRLERDAERVGVME